MSEIVHGLPNWIVDTGPQESAVLDPSINEDPETEQSLLEQLIRRDQVEPGAYEKFRQSMSALEWKNLRYSSEFFLRPDQMLKQGIGYTTLFLRSGRGTGKTVSGVFGVMDAIIAGHSNILFIGHREEDLVDTMIMDGLGKHMDPDYVNLDTDWNKKFNRIKIPAGRVLRGVRIPHEVTIRTRMATHTSEDTLRGPNPSFCWMDEVGSYPDIEGILDQTIMFVRGEPKPFPGGTDIEYPSRIITSTPVWSPYLIKMESLPSVYVRSVPSYVNSQHLSAAFRLNIKLLEGTRKGAQELLGKYINLDGENIFDQSMTTSKFLWDGHDWESFRSLFSMVVVGVDPSGVLSRTDKKSDEVGIVVCGRLAADRNRFVALADYSLRASPNEWTTKAMDVADEWQANAILYECQSDGAKSNLQHFNAARLDGRRGMWRFIKLTAPMDSVSRCASVANIFEQGRVAFLIRGGVDNLLNLKSQMYQMSYAGFSVKGASPDRVDAMVHCIAHLSGINSPRIGGGFFIDAAPETHTKDDIPDWMIG